MFNFGKNWLAFSQKALTTERVQQAQEDFAQLFEGIALQNKTFLDIGFGQGLSLLIAKQHGAQVVGCDINPTCQQALVQSSTHFPDIQLADILIFEGSILESTLVKQLLAQSHQQGFDIVHSWGVLHHTGNMQRAIEHAAALVKPVGILVVAIYNRHWSSSIWLAIKWLYSHAPNFLQKVLIYLF
ncbi:MAG: class I SAM-dependent methyltransferase, partial [Pseudomonadota bacterium]|nr:class I SAM-dependent methyltransferase [Pseudomonadota bacterium]